MRAYSDDSFDYCLDDGAVLVFGPGGDAEPATAILAAPTSETQTSTQTEAEIDRPSGAFFRQKPLIIAVAVLLLIGAGFIVYRSLSGRSVLPSSLSLTSQPSIKSLAVLPLRPLDASDNYLGMGIADAIIRRISQNSQLTVRPTSAIRKYLNDDIDALTAAKQLNADAILEGSVQRAGDQVRVSVNLLRTADGASIWNDNFDLKMTDIFVVQDTVSQQIVSRLNLRLDPTQQAGLKKQYTANPIAYEYYQRAIYSIDQRDENNRDNELASIELFKKAIEADPNFALAHAQLAYSYAQMATFIEPTNSKWVDMVNVEINTAQRLDPQIAEIHLVNSLILWSSYGGYQLKAAIRELLDAQQLNPNVGHAELGGLYSHVGLRDVTAREFNKAVEIDPTSEFLKSQIINQWWLLGDYDEWLAENHRLLGEQAGHPEHTLWYLLGKRRLDDAQKRIDEIGKDRADSPQFLTDKALFLALKGNFPAAEELIPVIVSKQPVETPFYHHATYGIACVYALEGKSAEAVKWLNKTAHSGYPCYPRFENDPYLDRIRRSPEFIQFMADMKTEWETYRSEFSGS